MRNPMNASNLPTRFKATVHLNVNIYTKKLTFGVCLRQNTLKGKGDNSSSLQ